MKRNLSRFLGIGIIVLALATLMSGARWYQQTEASTPEANTTSLSTPRVNNTPLPSPTPTAAGPCTSPTRTIDLKVLVLATANDDADLPAITQALDYLGVPYTVDIVTQKSGSLTPGMLANGCRGYYQGIMLTEGNLSHQVGSDYVSALSKTEWATLQNYEATWGVRQVNWYTYPTADFGYQEVQNAVDTTDTPILTNLTSQGKSVFSYLNPDATIPIRYAYTYLAPTLADGNTTPLLTDSKGNALASIHTYANKRQILSLTFDNNPNLTHSIVLSYGLVNWLTKGLFLGERHVLMSPQIDDIFIPDSDWQPNTPCGTAPDNTGVTYRITGADLQALLNWQTGKRTSTITPNMTLTMVFNGFGTAASVNSTTDTLTPFAVTNQGQFYWVNHTYDHADLNGMDYAAAKQEIQKNVQIAANTLHATDFSALNMVTPGISGLLNRRYLQAAHDTGIRYLVTDTSQKGYDNPSPNAGIYNADQPEILMIPRYPNDLYYNVSTPASWVAEYNCTYKSFWKKDLTYTEILDEESDQLLTYLLRGSIDPWMFHQDNLRAYDGTHSLLGDLLDATLQKYEQYYNLPIQYPTMEHLGQTMAARMQYNAAGVTASIIPGVSITIHAQNAARVPVTGLNKASAESYGGQHISYIDLAAGQSVTLPL
ncbi:MAG TPA: hypothetical protein VL485_33240 [Ktedonobacteraceae bacterium]|nr:hypothetical protein [Ktedonobacteraceae bacterium]